MEKKREELEAVRPITYIVGIVWVIILAIANLTLAGFCGGSPVHVFLQRGLSYAQWTHAPPPYTMDMAYMFLWLFVPVLIISALPKYLRLNRRETNVIYTMVICTILISTTYCHVPLSNALYTQYGGTWWPYHVEDWEPWQGPDPSVTEWYNGWAYGGAAVPWSAWLPNIYFTITVMFQFFTFIFLTVIIRRIYIDVENLPFPLASGAINLLETITPEKGKNIFRQKWIWVGTLIGFLVQAGYWLPFAAKQIYPSVINTIIDVSPQVAPYLPHSSVMFDWNIALIAACFFTSHSILLSYIIYWLAFFVILPVAFTYTGLNPKPIPGWGGGVQEWTWTGWNMMMGHPGAGSWDTWGKYVYGMSPFFVGGIIAFVVYPLFKQRKIFFGTLKCLWQKAPPEFERDEAIPYRWAWIGFIASFIIWFALLNHSTSWWFATLMPIIMVYWIIMINLFSMRMRGIFGVTFPFGVYTSHTPFYALTAWPAFAKGSPWFLGYPPTGQTMNTLYGPVLNSKIASGHIAVIQMGQGGLVQRADPSSRLLEGFKIGKVTGTRLRDILIPVLIAVPIVLVLSWALWLIFVYRYGAFEKFAASGVWMEMGSWWAWEWSVRTPYLFSHHPGDAAPQIWTLPWMLFGGVLISIIYVLIARYPTLHILHPAGFCMAGWFGTELVFAAFVAMILKRLVIRIGGLKLYEEKGVPFATGLLIGWGITVYLSAVLYTLETALA